MRKQLMSTVENTRRFLDSIAKKTSLIWSAFYIKRT
jgi:hypothetical protein